MKYEQFDGMNWPSLNGLAEIEWQLRYGIDPPRLDVAALVAAYGALIKATQRHRNDVCRGLLKRWKPTIGQPEQGCIARCSRGFLGLITSDKPISVTYPDGSTGLAWSGIHLERRNGVQPGDPWCSRTPQVVAVERIMGRIY